MDQIAQEINEKRYNRKHIDGYIREAIESNSEMVAKIKHGVELLEDYKSRDYYASKNARIKQLANVNLETLVMDVFVGAAYCQTPELFTSVTAQMASRLHFSDKAEAIVTVAEIMSVLCMTDAYDIIKPNRQASLMVQSRIPLEEKLIDYIMNSQYLPPMVCEPLELVHNYSGAHLTHSDSLILGQGNHHDGDICLDVLNIMNRVRLSLDIEFLCKVEEEPTFALDTPEKIEQWKRFKVQSYRFYDLMQSQGNVFHLTHKVDKRGRIYAQGYHINTQGTSFKKAMIELADMEYVTGVPDA